MNLSKGLSGFLPSGAVESKRNRNSRNKQLPIPNTHEYTPQFRFRCFTNLSSKVPSPSQMGWDFLVPPPNPRNWFTAVGAFAIRNSVTTNLETIALNEQLSALGAVCVLIGTDHARQVPSVDEFQALLIADLRCSD